ncbi:VOC family protein [Halopenitus persicus]|uniref:Catechol-2,3-dioxygenase n=1 Tax=Halopenitus persicus TaxID=1048396 RepID=A0A1H3HB79_9EURY|nr:VOC family protein [Halopenitus persicus]SDY11879.1 Catechol-2,3-dioxygenase [Halopenitus persicus]
MTVTRLTHLALEVRSLDRARAFYEDRLGLGRDRVRRTDREVAYAVGDSGSHLVLRRPRSVPRGGVHTHFAFSTTGDAYDAWIARCRDLDPVERTFGSYRSLYVDDPDGHCVEIGTTEGTTGDHDGETGDCGDDDPGDDAGTAVRDEDAPELTGIFEVVLEVASLERSEAIYRSLGFEVVDRGSDRPRVRLRGPFDLELWEPHLGIAGARGGLHVDLGLASDDSEADAARIADANDAAGALEPIDGGFRVRDPDGHRVSIVGDDARLSGEDAP